MITIKVASLLSSKLILYELFICITIVFSFNCLEEKVKKNLLKTLFKFKNIYTKKNDYSIIASFILFSSHI